jgi:hypothetical protein
VKHQQNYKQNYDRNRANPQLNVGDLVLKRLTTSRTKLSSLYTDPMTIIKVQHPTYWIQDDQTDNVYQVHISQLRSCSRC